MINEGSIVKSGYGVSDLAKKKAEGSVDRRNRFAKLRKTLLFARFHFGLARKH